MIKKIKQFILKIKRFLLKMKRFLLKMKRFFVKNQTIFSKNQTIFDNNQMIFDLKYQAILTTSSVFEYIKRMFIKAIDILKKSRDYLINYKDFLKKARFFEKIEPFLNLKNLKNRLAFDKT